MTRHADQLKPGNRIHITPHDVFRDSDAPIPTEHCPDAIVTVEKVIREEGWSVVLICWRCGSSRRATTYDADAPVEVTS